MNSFRKKILRWIARLFRVGEGQANLLWPAASSEAGSEGAQGHAVAVRRFSTFVHVGQDRRFAEIQPTRGWVSSWGSS